MYMYICYGIYIFYLSFIGCRMCKNLMLVNKSNSKCCTSYHLKKLFLHAMGFFYCKKPALVIYKGLLNIRYPDLSKKFI